MSQTSIGGGPSSRGVGGMDGGGTWAGGGVRDYIPSHLAGLTKTETHKTRSGNTRRPFQIPCVIPMAQIGQPSRTASQISPHVRCRPPRPSLPPSAHVPRLEFQACPARLSQSESYSTASPTEPAVLTHPSALRPARHACLGALSHHVHRPPTSTHPERHIDPVPLRASRVNARPSHPTRRGDSSPQGLTPHCPFRCRSALLIERSGSTR